MNLLQQYNQFFFVSDNQRTCPKCGHPILVDINQYIKANRFVRCENCDHMFTVVGENDANKGRNSKVNNIPQCEKTRKLEKNREINSSVNKLV